MDSQGEDTELELTKIGVNNSGDSLRTDQKAKLRADQRAKKKLLEQTKKLSNKLNLTNRNPGLAGREIPFFYLVVLGCSIFLLYTIIQNIILLLQAQKRRGFRRRLNIRFGIYQDQMPVHFGHS